MASEKKPRRKSPVRQSPVRRLRTRKRARPTYGVPPGTLTIDPDAPHPEVDVVAYGPDDVVEKPIADPGELESLIGSAPVVWVNVVGLGDETILRQLGEVFRIHRLALEDIVNIGQRPKVEPYDEHLFIVARMPPETPDDEPEQLSILLSKGLVVTFQEKKGDCFEGVRERIRKAGRLIRKEGADYLTYALLDAVVDGYFPVLDALRDELEQLEEEVLEDPSKETVAKIHLVKQRLVGLRRAIGPHREAINSLLRDSIAFVTSETVIHLRDCYDHQLRLAELVEIYREQCADLMNTYLTIVSNRMNEVMKVLTIIATIFIPLGFVAGLYGMNFDPEVSGWNMPELRWVYGYPYALFMMAAISGGLVWYFWRKGWLR